jgi:acetylornithine deacetylase/succinyl-diaminopimelate desuccinylase-like protein
MAADDSRDVLERVERDQERYLAELVEFLRIPSISTDPEFHPEVERCSLWLEQKLRDAGLQTERIDAGGHPLVYGEWLGAPGKPTVLFYGHYDVQPVDPIDEWRHDPFAPTAEGDDLVARGATDDKGQSYTHVKAVEALLQTRGTLPVNVKFLIEGEEECGGAAIDRFVIGDRGQRLACDCVVISDSSMHAPGLPSMVYGLRGIAYMELEVRGPDRDLHSGTYGGAVVNPLNAMAPSSPRSRTRRTGASPSTASTTACATPRRRSGKRSPPSPAAVDEYQRDLQVAALDGERGYTPSESATIRPTCDVNGMWGGYQGRGAKTVLPARAGAKISMRLVPDQDPDDIGRRFVEHVRKVAPPGVRTKAELVHGGRPILLPTDGPYFQAAGEALERTFGAAPVRVREGGSVPVVNTFAEVLGKPILLMGYGLPDDRLHSPNEKMSIRQYYDGIRCTVRLLDLLGGLGA